MYPYTNIIGLEKFAGCQKYTFRQLPAYTNNGVTAYLLVMVPYGNGQHDSGEPSSAAYRVSAP